MRLSLRILCLIIAMPLLCSSSVARADEKPWTGKDVILKRNDIKIARTENGRQVYVAKLTSISYRVLAEQEGWLKVRQGNKEGWFDKDLAVLLQDADTVFSGLIETDPENVQLYARRGWAFYLLENYGRAASDYSQAIRLQPNEVDWYISRGVILRAKSDYDGAIRDFSSAIRLNPAASGPYHNRGWTYCLKQDYDKAIADCTESLRLDPNDCYARNRRGLTWMYRGNYDRATQDFTDVLTDHECTWALKNRAMTWSRSAQNEKAIKDYERVIKMSPTEAEPYNSLAWILATCDDPQLRDGRRAVELAKKACSLSGEKVMTNQGTLAAALASVGRFDEAIQLQEKALADPAYDKTYGSAARERLKLYREKKPYVDVRVALKPKSDPTLKDAPKTAPVTIVGSGPLKGWREFKSPDRSFTVIFPEKPKAHKQPSAIGDFHGFSHEGAEAMYMVSYVDVPKDSDLTLDRSATAYAIGRQGKITSQKKIRVGDHRGLELTVSLPNDKTSRVRLIEIGKRRFQIFVDGPSDVTNSEQATAFLDSFKLVRD
jgi:tetratricopeptide (TPR) repeat protein